MDKIDVNGSLMDVRVLFSAEKIHQRTKKLADQINHDYGTTETLAVLIVLNGAFVFAADLVRMLQMPTEIESIRMKSYEGTQSSGHIQLLMPLPDNLAGKHVLIVEDIVDTGRSLSFLWKELQRVGAASVKICSLLNKPLSHESKDLKIDYVGFDIGKNFVIGYGLDLDSKYRNLPYIADLISPQ